MEATKQTKNYFFQQRKYIHHSGHQGITGSSWHPTAFISSVPSKYWRAIRYFQQWFLGIMDVISSSTTKTARTTTNSQVCVQNQKSCVHWSVSVQGKLKVQLLYGRIPSSHQCTPSFEVLLENTEEFQSKFTQCPWAVRESMKGKVNKGVNVSSQWNMGDQVLLKIRNIWQKNK